MLEAKVIDGGKKMYGGLPVGIFGDDVAKCLNMSKKDLEKKYKKNIERHVHKSKQFEKDIQRKIEEDDGEDSDQILLYKLYNIQHFPEGERTDIIKEGLINGDFPVKKIAAEMILYAPPGDQERLKKLVKEKIIEGLEDEDVREAAVEMIPIAPEEEQEGLRKLVGEKIKEGLSDYDEDVRKAALKMIPTAPEDQRTLFIESGLKDKYRGVGKVAAEMIPAAPEEEQEGLRKLVQEKIERGLGDIYPGVRKAALKMIPTAPEDQRTLFIESGLKDKDEGVRKVAAEISKKYLLSLFGKHELYYYNNKNGTSRLVQSSTGDTIEAIVHEKLIGKVYRRTMGFIPFTRWKKAREAHDIRKKMGFDYVPIEPILSFSLQKDGKVSVYAKVLHVSLEKFLQSPLASRWSKQLRKQEQKIIQGLRQLHISHNDIHDQNLVLLFSYHEDGSIDMDACPRLYLIDWDKAV